MLPWLLIAAEPEELAGILKRVPAALPLDWPGASVAYEIPQTPAGSPHPGAPWWLVASGPGPRGIERILRTRPGVSGIVNIGFCGALDPVLGIGDIVVSGECLRRAGGVFVQGRSLCLDRVAVTTAEKRQLRESTGASVIEMESAAVAAKAQQWDLPFRAVRAVSDTAKENMPLDFNQHRDSEGRFTRASIVRSALRRPFTAIPGLIRLQRNCRRATESLGEFLVNCEF